MSAVDTNLREKKTKKTKFERGSNKHRLRLLYLTNGALAYRITNAAMVGR